MISSYEKFGIKLVLTRFVTVDKTEMSYDKGEISKDWVEKISRKSEITDYKIETTNYKKLITKEK